MHNASHIFQVVRARTAPAARLLLALGSGLVFAGATLAPAAQAQEAQPRVERQQQREMPRDMQREAQRQEMLQRQEMQRQMMLREQRAYEEQQRRLLQAQQEQEQQQEQQEGQRRHGRMTADERSELRRQINEANQDIYSRPRGRR